VLKATVQNDSTQMGVTWNLSPASGAGSLSNVTTTSATYNPPAGALASPLTVTVTATSVSSTSVSAKATLTVPATVVVSVSPDSATVPAGSTQVLTASIQNDPGHAGVTWTISPASGAGTLSNVTSISATYNAPAGPPPSDVVVIVTATSVSSTSTSASATLTVPAAPASVVSVSPDTATVPAGSNQTFTATVQYDSGQKGVTWKISPASGAGTLSNITSTSVTYNAPAGPPPSDVAVTITATSVSNATASGTATVTLPASVVSISPGAATVPAGSSQVLTATVQYDPAQTGVSWSISPSSGAGTLTNLSSTSATYNAPASAPVSDLSASIKATSLTSAASGTAVITVPPIAVWVTPDSALIPVKSVQTFKATVQYDPTKGGVTWSLSQGAAACSSACGAVTVVDATTAKYSAPASVPTNPVTLTATSVNDTTKSGTASINVSTGTVQLSPDSLSFGIVRKYRSKVLNVTLSNVGASPLAVSGISVSGSFYSLQTSTCGSSVAAAASCDIGVKFTPRALGPRSGTLTITDSSSDSPQQVPLHGTGCLNCARMAAVRAAVASVTRVAAPAPTGPNGVGTRVLDLVDANRAEPFQGGDARRELLVRFWYPGAIKSECRQAPYTDPAVWDYFSKLLGVPLPAVRTHSCLAAPVLEGAWPVVVFTHGYTGTFTDYTFLFEDLASRGYVVASVDHTYEAAAVALPDGRLVKSVFGSPFSDAGRADNEALMSAEAVRLRDVQFVVDELARLNARPDSPFAGRIDTASIAIAGHSFGGLTALQAVLQDARIRAAVLIDGVVTEKAIEATEKPVLILDAGRMEWNDAERHLWDKLQGPRYAVNLRNSEHVAPTDAVWLARGAIWTGNMSPENTVAAVREYVAAFLEAHLLGRPAVPLLTHPSMRYPDTEVSGPAPIVRTAQ
jgi:dienelactone hydrolase